MFLLLSCSLLLSLPSLIGADAFSARSKRGTQEKKSASAARGARFREYNAVMVFASAMPQGGRVALPPPVGDGLVWRMSVSTLSALVSPSVQHACPDLLFFPSLFCSEGSRSRVRDSHHVATVATNQGPHARQLLLLLRGRQNKLTCLFVPRPLSKCVSSSLSSNCANNPPSLSISSSAPPDTHRTAPS